MEMYFGAITDFGLVWNWDEAHPLLRNYGWTDYLIYLKAGHVETRRDSHITLVCFFFGGFWVIKRALIAQNRRCLTRFVSLAPYVIIKRERDENHPILNKRKLATCPWRHRQYKFCMPCTVLLQQSLQPSLYRNMSLRGPRRNKRTRKSMSPWKKLKRLKLKVG